MIFREPVWITVTWDGPGAHPMPGSPRNPLRIVTVPLCPDLLRYEYIGAADGARGRVVRAFFWLLRWWP